MRNMNPVYEKLMRCLNSVKEKVDFVPEIALVLGSGLGRLRGSDGDCRDGGLPRYRGFSGYLPPRGTRGRFVFGYVKEVSLWWSCRGEFTIMRAMI